MENEQNEGAGMGGGAGFDKAKQAEPEGENGQEAGHEGDPADEES